MRRLWFTVGVCRRWPRVPQLHKPHKHTQHMYADSEHGSRTHMYSECVCWFKVCGLYCTFIEQSHRHSMRRRYTSKSLGVGGARRRGGARGEVAELQRYVMPKAKRPKPKAAGVTVTAHGQAQGSRGVRVRVRVEASVLFTFRHRLLCLLYSFRHPPGLTRCDARWSNFARWARAPGADRAHTR